MKYFTDRQILEMKQQILDHAPPDARTAYMMYIDRIEQLNQLYDKGQATREELLRAMSDFQHFSEQHIPHNRKVDKDDEDADAYEYENYEFRPQYQ